MNKSIIDFAVEPRRLEKFHGNNLRGSYEFLLVLVNVSYGTTYKI